MFMPDTTPAFKATIVDYDILPPSQTGKHSPSSIEVTFGQVIRLRDEIVGVQDELGTDDAVFVEDRSVRGPDVREEEVWIRV